MPGSPPQDPWLTVPEVAEELGFSEQTVRNWIKAKQLRAVQPNGREYRVRRSWLDAFVASTEGPASAQPMPRPLRSAALTAQFTPPDER
jgi:excisionase family DNA binding protein